MRRLLACLWYYFASQRILPWISAAGLVTITIGLFDSAVTEQRLIALGAVLLMGFPGLIGGLAFRQLISNRRVALVPDIRAFATFGLFLLAAGSGVLAGLAAAAIEPAPTAVRVGALAFAAVSIYLLLTQWLLTYRLGTLAVMFVPFLLVRLGATSDPLFRQQLFVPWAWAAVAGLAWLWLGIAVRGPLLPRGVFRWDRPGTENAGDTSGQIQVRWPFQGGQGATAAGTLMRGLGDSWGNEIRGALFAALMMPVVMSVMVGVVGLPLRGLDAQRYGGQFFLVLSFFGVCVFPAMLFADWPARVRLIWLRIAGDRAELWRRLERALAVDALLITAVTTVLGGGFLLWSSVPRDFIVLYMTISALMCVLGPYLSFWARASGWPAYARGAMLGVIVLGTIASVGRLRGSDDPGNAFWVLAVLAPLALLFRSLARSRFARIDWCEVRPLRFPRRVV